MDTEAVKVEIGTVDLFEGAGSFSLETCYWTPAVVEHTARFTSDGVVHLDEDASAIASVVASANNTQASTNMDPAKIRSTMDFLVIWLGGFVAANVSALPPDSQYPTWGLNSDSISASGWKYYKSDNASDIQFGDPSRHIIRSLDDLLFRAAIAASEWKNLTNLMDPGLSPKQSCMENQTSTRNVYNTDFRWYAAATGAQLLAIVAILPLFWGWWNLQQDLDLSPFDVALAFDAPLLIEKTQNQGRVLAVLCDNLVTSECSTADCTTRKGHVKLEDGMETGTMANDLASAATIENALCEFDA